MPQGEQVFRSFCIVALGESFIRRLDEYDKKNDEISRKFSTLLQELNKCKTELQYWRCKSPATSPVCSSCGNIVVPDPDEIQALVNQGVNQEELGEFKRQIFAW